MSKDKKFMKELKKKNSKPKILEVLTYRRTCLTLMKMSPSFSRTQIN